MSPTLILVLLWLAFAVTHMVLSSIRFRPKLVAVLGEQGFLGVYSLIALGTFVPLCMVYFSHEHTGPLLWALPLTPVLVWVVQIGMGVAFILVFAALLTPSPTSMTAGATEGAPQPRGVHYITRHALLMGFGLFGALHLLVNGWASDVAFFAGFPLFAVVGASHQDQRKLALDGDRYRPFYEATPLIPFTGRSTLRGLREISWLAVGLGIAATVLVRTFHASWFGSG